jgi:hypothetical protein
MRTPKPPSTVISRSFRRLLFRTDDSVVQAFEARLQSLEDEILRLVKLASETDDRKVRQKYLDLAQDLQKDARETGREHSKNRRAVDGWDLSTAQDQS